MLQNALIPAIRGYFPNTRVQGCYFHFCQAVHRKKQAPAPDIGIGCDGHPDSASTIRKRYRW
ncbi:hypothetical protein T03_8155 [Trichinella britovi]|uniref:MULE transposase domain-containing protein n=1 Tax=Trichinella britovi TaxID=45882 RepID=A0A0V1AKA1_TRIBR|nr:hypothetical protein T03_8155 [Trichinella britovi]